MLTPTTSQIKLEWDDETAIASRERSDQQSLMKKT